MGWGYTTGEGGRDQGYIVPSLCDQPGCNEEIDRGLSFRCGEYRSDNGCSNFFCDKHLQWFTLEDDEEENAGDAGIQFCDHCLWHLEHPDADYDDPKQPPYHEPKPDLLKWVLWKRYDKSWQGWRDEDAKDVKSLDKRIAESDPKEVAELMLELVPQMEQFQADDEVTDMKPSDTEAKTKGTSKSPESVVPTNTHKEPQA